VEWDGDATSRIAVKGIPEGLDRSIFRLEPEQADWVDKMCENRTLHGMPSEARLEGLDICFNSLSFTRVKNSTILFVPLQERAR
jgi:hypothetical protein